MQLMSTALAMAESGRLPDSIVRVGIRQLLGQRTRQFAQSTCELQQEYVEQFLKDCRESPLAVHTQQANEQHYEVPASFFDLCLGERKKYSCCYYPTTQTSLDEAEVHALKITCQRAQIEDGMTVLELGCGWGSLSLWMAENYPNSRILAVSNSHSQRESIESTAKEKGLKNLTVQTADMNDFRPPTDFAPEGFDRCVSVEMFEHMRNHSLLLKRISEWLNDQGKLFVHIFAHRASPYLFEDQGPSDWMTRHFFSGGMMPSDDLFHRYQEDLKLAQRWRWNGFHYAKTCRDWLRRTDRSRDQILKVLQPTYQDQTQKWFQRWRIFFMACEELFAANHGNEWWVSHYLFEQHSRS